MRFFHAAKRQETPPAGPERLSTIPEMAGCGPISSVMVWSVIIFSSRAAWSALSMLTGWREWLAR